MEIERSINGSFPHEEVNEKNAKSYLSCPFNVTHKIKFEDFQFHIERCDVPKSQQKLVKPCPFNKVHYYPDSKEEEQKHFVKCPNYKDIPQPPPVVPKAPLKRLPDMSERPGLENPRELRTRLSPHEVVLGPDFKPPVMKPDIPRTLTLYENYRRGYEGAVEYIMSHGWDSYGSKECMKYTTYMSPREKVEFAKFLDEYREKLEIYHGIRLRK